ncbi:MAG TPA: TAXI family TRAP transporter solute-binding subunit [Burkholderiales bacterium]|nr:TAXI family TRAP transporter solute-binding subunit [Burkholderiales bacterium]
MRRLLLLLLLGVLTACSRGPDVDMLQRDVEARLAEALPADTLTLEALYRRGSQKDVKSPDGETRRIVYFDVDLKLTKNYDFGAWDSPGVAGVISALGTGPRGLSGIVSGGNRAGDIIRAHGTAIYKQADDGKWSAVAPVGFRNVVAPDVASGAPRPAPELLLEAMRNVIATAPPETTAATRDVIVQELQVAHAAIQSRLARVQHGYAIAAGANGGQYLRFAQALGDGKTRVVPLITAGGEDNLRMVRALQAPLGMAQGDSALMAYEGKGPFQSEGRYTTLRAIGSLYPEPIHVVVRADSTLRRMSDLVGKRVSIGVPGAASRTTAVAVLEAHGIPLAKLGEVVEFPLNDGLVALRQQEIDALIQVIGFPSASIRDATAAVPLRLLPLDEGAIRKLTAQSPAYFPLTLPRGTYPHQGDAVSTIATAAILVTGTEMTDAEIAGITRMVYARGQDLVARGSAQGAQLSAANAHLGLAVPMHTAAEEVIAELRAASQAP